MTELSIYPRRYTNPHTGEVKFISIKFEESDFESLTEDLDKYDDWSQYSWTTPINTYDPSKRLFKESHPANLPTE